MFKDHWLVADVDGTLLPTPSKAGGKYLSFAATSEAFGKQGRAYHSCLPPLQRFLRLGGSLCVVSTAGRRLWHQVYADLAPTLYAPPPPSPLPTATQQQVESPGRLLVCGFTGAALLRSIPPARLPAEWRPTQAHAVAERLPAPSSAGPPASVALEEWVEYRTLGQTTLSESSQAAAAEEGRAAIIRFFEHASAVSGHDIDRARAFFASCLSTKYHRVFTEMLAQMLAETHTGPSPSSSEGPAAPVCFANTTTMDMSRLTTHGCFLVETNDALVDCQRVPLADGSVPANAPVAQVVVMGIPMKFFDLVFPRAADSRAALQCCPACRSRATRRPPEGRGEKEASEALAGVARLSRLGLAVKRQPNSVCIHREHVDKATCVRWLVQHAGALGRGCSFALHRALSFGDVPATVDRPLAEFPPMRMLSLSPLPHDGCASAAEREALVDTGMLHVGGEEEGTALFLNLLLDACEAEGKAGGGLEAAGGGTWFTEARVRACAAKAAQEVAHL